MGTVEATGDWHDLRSSTRAWASRALLGSSRRDSVVRLWDRNARRAASEQNVRKSVQWAPQATPFRTVGERALCGQPILPERAALPAIVAAERDRAVAGRAMAFVSRRPRW